MTLRMATAISARIETRFVSELQHAEAVELVRRCADIAEVLSAVEAGVADLVAVSADFPGVNGSVLAELTVRGARVLGVSAASSLIDVRQFEGWGIEHVHRVGADDLQRTIDQLNAPRRPTDNVRAQSDDTLPAAGSLMSPGEGVDDETLLAPATTTQALHEASAEEGMGGATGAATVVVVCGPSGAPGRTTVATNLAAILAGSDSTLLIDADTCAPSVAGYLGLLDEAPAILAAARLVDAGTLTPPQLQELCLTALPRLDVLSGIAGSNRWAELGRHHLERILSCARGSYEWIVIDTSGQFIQEESLLYDTIAPMRHAATVVALENADHVLAVGAADPIQLQRFVSGWRDLRDASVTEPLAVMNRARHGAVGGKPDVVVANALQRFADVSVAVMLPDDRDAFDDAVLNGKCVVEQEPMGEFAQQMRKLATLVGAQLSGEAPRRRGLRMNLPRRRAR